MITHYLPQFLLDRFRGQTLLEMDIEAGTVRSRSILRAGSADDLWPDEIERGIMGKHDDAAARILRAKVWGKTSIRLTPDERYDLAQWLLLFMPRTPLVPKVFRHMRDAFDANPELAVEALRERPDEVLDVMRTRDPRTCEQVLAELGPDAGRAHLLEIAFESVRRRAIPYLPDPTQTYEQHLHNVQGTIDRIAERVARMRWTWYRTDGGFCIGDNPLCRWHIPSREPIWNMALHKDAEVTFPVSTELTLCITKLSGRREIADVVLCNRGRTRDFNHRQRLSALRYVYAHSAGLLNPQARHGFDAPPIPSLAGRQFQLPGVPVRECPRAN